MKVRTKIVRSKQIVLFGQKVVVIKIAKVVLDAFPGRCLGTINRSSKSVLNRFFFSILKHNIFYFRPCQL